MSYYSQFQEDEFIVTFLQEKQINIVPFFVEIGACDGIHLSNSRYFIEHGWSALLIEPNKDVYEVLVNNNIDFPLVKTLNVAITNFKGKRYLTEEGHYSLSSVTKIDTGLTCDCILFKSLDIHNIGIISIDTEGYDTNILQQILKCELPEIIIIESNYMRERTKQIKLLNKDYYLLRALSVNTIWIRKDLYDL